MIMVSDLVLRRPPESALGYLFGIGFTRDV